MTEESLISSLYPPPPPYYKFFTDESLHKFNELKSKTPSITEEQLPDEEKNLQYLIPPKPPSGETYRSFGNIWHFNDKIPRLEDMGIAQLYKETDIPNGEDSKFKIEELKKLLKSLLLNFLEIVGVMSVSPDQFVVKIEHIRTILINIHHLLNEYRPHQSRESLILLLEKQVETKKDEIKEIERVCNEVESKIKDLVELYIDNKKPEEKEGLENVSREENKGQEESVQTDVGAIKQEI